MNKAISNQDSPRKRIVITYGTFDVLHQGHINLLRRAKELGDWLIVGVTTELTDYDITEQLCCSILPTATQYARNALFAGLMPSEIKQRYPDWWTEEDAEESKNLNEQTENRHQICF